MGVAEVTARIDAINARIDQIDQIGQRVSPGIRIAQSEPAGQDEFARMLSAQGSTRAPEQLTSMPGGPGVVSGPALAPTSFSAVDRPAALSGKSSSEALSPTELRDVLSQAGFSGESLRVAWAIAMRESGGRPGATSKPNSNGTIDHGLFQINDVHRGSWIDFSRLDDPVYSAQVAYRMSDQGTNFSAWGLGTTGWAGHLKENSPATYQALYDRFMTEYNKYPS